MVLRSIILAITGFIINGVIMKIDHPNYRWGFMFCIALLVSFFTAMFVMNFNYFFIPWCMMPWLIYTTVICHIIAVTIKFKSQNAIPIGIMCIVIIAILFCIQHEVFLL